MLNRFYAWLDMYVFPKVTAFWAHPFNILLTMLLFVPLVVAAKVVVLVLLINSWMNAGSFSTSQITLRAVLLTADAQEKRAQQDHEAIQTEFKQLNEVLAILKEEMSMQRDEIQELKAIMDDVREIKGFLNNKN